MPERSGRLRRFLRSPWLAIAANVFVVIVLLVQGLQVSTLATLVVGMFLIQLVDRVAEVHPRQRRRHARR